MLFIAKKGIPLNESERVECSDRTQDRSELTVTENKCNRESWESQEGPAGLASFLVWASSQTRLENVRTLLTSYSPTTLELFLNRKVKAQLGMFLSPMDERRIAF
ncbi:hypothetical protein Tco_0569771 [Tanacetum coccineum]